MAIWIPTRPGSEDRWSDVPGILRGNWETYGEATSAEHGPLGSSASGTHALCGIEGTCYYGTTTQIAALDDPPSGALAYDQTLGWLKRYWANSWNQTTSANWSRARWYLNTTTQMTAVTGNSQTVGLSFDGKTYDSSSEYASATSKFVTSADGNYLILCQATLVASGVQGTSSAASATEDVATGFTRTAVTCSLAPTGDLSKSWTCTETNHYGALDNASPAGSTRIYTNTTNALDSFTIPSFNLPATFLTSTVESGSVAISGYYKATTTGTMKFRAVLSVGGPWYWSDELSATTTAGYQTSIWTTNPASTTAWTLDEMNGVGASAVSAIGLCAIAVGNFVECQWLRIVARGDNSSHYEYIDEYPVADDLAYLSATCNTTTFPTDTFSASGGWTIPALATNISASVYIRAKRGTGSVASAGSILILSNGTPYSGHAASIPFCALGTDFITYQFIWPNNPSTSAPWTVAQINGTASNQSLTGFGVYTSGGVTTTEVDVSQMYPVVDWQQSEPENTLEIWKNHSKTGCAALAKTVSHSPQTGVTRNDSVRALTMAKLSCGDSVTFHLTKTLTNDSVVSGSDSTYFCMHRMGVSCL
jgi:hypothetical protein